MAGWIRKRPDRPSPWRAGYRGPDGQERSRSFKRKIDAERWLRDETGKVDRGQWVDPDAGKRRFGEWAETWLASKTRIKPKTERGYRSLLRSRILPTFGTTPLSSVSREAVSDWVAEMVDEGLSPSRIRQAHQLLSAILEDAHLEGIIGRNPAKRVELPRVEEPPRRFLSGQQVARLAEAMPDERDRVLVYVLAYGGLRWGEAVALRRSRVDVLRRRLHIVESAAEVAGGMDFGAPKTHQTRYVSLPAFVADRLGAYLEAVWRHEDAFVFPSSSGGPLWYASHRRIWDRAREEAGPDLADITPHDLRHSCASLMRQAGADVKAIQQQLGHRSPVVTMSVYTHLFDGELDDVMGRLDEAHAGLVRPTSGPSVEDLGDARSRNRR